MASPQQQIKESFARALGYDGPMEGFNSFIQSDPAASEKYKGCLLYTSDAADE